jgi:hypothetical protein
MTNVVPYWAHAGLDGAASATSNPKSTQSLSARGAGSETAIGAAKGEIVAPMIEVFVLKGGCEEKKIGLKVDVGELLFAEKENEDLSYILVSLIYHSA